MGIIKTRNQKTLILALLGLCAVSVNAHADNFRCGQANVVCRKHQWMLMGMFAIFLTYIWMYGEMILIRYFGTCYRWFQEKFGAKPAVGHAHGHRSCGGCDHHHHHRSDEESESECDHHHCGGCDHRHENEECNHSECDHKHECGHHHHCGGCGCDHHHEHAEEKKEL